MNRCGIDTFVSQADAHPIFDVRTPAEFSAGHVPKAINLALFSDRERAEVGALYSEKGRQSAVLHGLEVVGPKMRRLVEQAESHCPPPGPVLMHCWRGGMRSSSLAWLLELYGYQVTVLEGGYKAYRAHVRSICETEFPELIVLGGLTGVGKTEVLDELDALGEQIIDLEGLANHRGSSFGGIDRDDVVQQQFSNQLAEVIGRLDADRRVWIEDESRHVGRCRVPAGLFDQMGPAALVCLEVPRAARLRRLVDEYGDHPSDQLVEAFERIESRLGGKRFQVAMDALDVGDYRTACHEALRYYDKAYTYGMDNRDGPVMSRLTYDQRPSSADIARRCIGCVE